MREPNDFGWRSVGKFDDILYFKSDGIAKIVINRPEVRNAFRPTTLFELSGALNDAREDPAIGVIVLTGAGEQAFCSGGIRRSGAMRATWAPTEFPASTSSICRSRSAPAPSRSSRWWRATRSAAATFCTWFAISRSRPRTRDSARRVLGSEASMAVSARACWRI